MTYLILSTSTSAATGNVHQTNVANGPNDVCHRNGLDYLAAVEAADVDVGIAAHVAAGRSAAVRAHVVARVGGSAEGAAGVAAGGGTLVAEVSSREVGSVAEACVSAESKNHVVASGCTRCHRRPSTPCSNHRARAFHSAP